MMIFSALFCSLLLTLLLEAAFFLLCGKRDKKDFLLCLLLNLLTNPPVVLLYWLAALAGASRWAAAAVLEACAILAEGWGYRRYGRQFGHPLLFSLLANAFSYGVGLLLPALSTIRMP